MKTNKFVPTPKVFTHEGATAARINAVQQLRRSVLATLLFEDEFYEDGKSIAGRIQDEVKSVLKLKDGADIVANIAYEARTKQKLRHAPLWLALALVNAQTEETRKVISGLLYSIIQRADEPGEFLSMYWKGGKKPIPNQVKIGLGEALKKFDEYSLAKNDKNSAAIRLRDVLFLTHPKPENAEQEALWKKLAEDTLETPDTWETQLSAGADKKETFTRLIQEGKLGALALLRNLRNMIQAGVDIAVIREALKSMKTERVLPFRFITAARYAPQLEPELEQAMFKSIEGLEKLPGKTILAIDTSGSMGSQVSGKSEISRRDAAAALAMLLRELCDDVEIIAFGSTAGVVKPRRGFALNDEIGSGKFGHGTNIAAACQLAATRKCDRLIVITDEQSATPTGIRASDGKGYFINVASYKNGIGYGDWVHIDGWSESVLDYIQQYEKLDEK